MIVNQKKLLTRILRWCKVPQSSSTTVAIQPPGSRRKECIMLQDLCEDLMAAKGYAEEAKKEVLRIENLILALAPEKLEGSQTLPVPGFKLTVTHKLTRTLDFDAYRALDLPENMQFVTLKPAIDLFKLRAIERLDPFLVAQCVTVKPAKTAIKVEVEG